MSKRKVIVIAIDSLEADLIENYGATLPNLQALVQKSKSFRIDSIYPPDSYPAWRSIFTGLTPAEHGLVFTPDVFESTAGKIAAMNNSGIEGKTFWDELGRGGNKVCVLFPLTAFPSWAVNGIMVTRSEEVADETGTKYRKVSVFPEGAIDLATIPNLRDFTGRHPGESGLPEFKAKAMHWAERDAEFALKISKETEWDFLFAYFMELDTIQHYFWRYCDPKDPMYTPNPHQNTIREFYEFFDALIGRFQAAHPNADIVVMSDHGHTMRPVNTINLNEVLRRAGYLRTSRVPGRRLLERAKQISLKIAKRTRTERLLIRAGQKVPGAKKIYTAESLVDSKRSRAYLSGFRGPKSYPEGGVVINREGLSRDDYERVRDEIMALLCAKIPETAKSPSALQWIRRREELYTGPHVQLYPDIVFRLGGGFGVGWDLHGALAGVSYEHALSSGGHTEMAVFLSNVVPEKTPRNLLEVREALLRMK